MNTDQFEFENSPMGQHYIYHLQDEDEISLHALEILQSGLTPCYLPVQYYKEKRILSIDMSGCIALTQVSGKYRSYIRRHYRRLLTGFLVDVIRALDQTLCFSGICFSEDQLYFDKRRQRLVCIYLPVHSLLIGHSPLLSEFDENAFDELLAFPYEKRWISTTRTDKLYAFFREDDEISSFHYLKKDLWQKYDPLSRSLKNGILAWVTCIFLYLFVSSTVGNSGNAPSLLILSKTLFLISTAILLLMLLATNRKKSKKESIIQSKKEERRKKRNTSILFPSDSRLRKQELLLAELSPDPVQFLLLKNTEDAKNMEQAFTIWTDHFVVGQDSDCCDYSIDDPSLSLTHALFQKDAQGLSIEDLDSQYGTFVNRKRLLNGEKVYLQDGDILGLGNLEFLTRFI